MHDGKIWRRSLREKCLNTECFLVRIFPHLDWIRKIRSICPYSVRMRENTDQRKFRIWTLSKVVAIYHFQRIFIWLCKPSDLSIFFPSTSKSSFNGRSLLHVVTLLEQILTWKFPETRDSPSYRKKIFW